MMTMMRLFSFQNWRTRKTIGDDTYAVSNDGILYRVGKRVERIFPVEGKTYAFEVDSDTSNEQVDRLLAPVDTPFVFDSLFEGNFRLIKDWYDRHYKICGRVKKYTNISTVWELQEEKVVIKCLPLVDALVNVEAKYDPRLRLTGLFLDDARKCASFISVQSLRAYVPRFKEFIGDLPRSTAIYGTIDEWEKFWSVAETVFGKYKTKALVSYDEKEKQWKIEIKWYDVLKYPVSFEVAESLMYTRSNEWSVDEPVSLYNLIELSLL